MPRTAEVFIGQAAGLPVLASGLLDGASPAGALGLQRDGALDLLFGVHVRSGAELLAQLTTGADASYVVERVGGVSCLEAKTGGGMALALQGNYLLIAEHRSSIKKGAAFLVQELGAEARKEQGVFANAPRTALVSLSAFLKRSWQKKRQQLRDSLRETQKALGRPPDFAEPAAALAAVDSGMDALLALVETSDEIRIEMVPRRAQLELSGSLRPTAGGNAAELLRDMRVGDAKPLLALRDNVGLALLSRSSRQARVESAGELTAQVKALLESRLSRADEEHLRELLLDLARGRGEVLTAGVATQPPASVFLKTDVGDSEHMKLFVDNLWKVLEITAIAEPLAGLLGAPLNPRFARHTVQGKSVRMASLASTRTQNGSIGVVWSEPESHFSVSVSSETPLKAFKSFNDSSTGTLASDRAAAAALAQVSASAWVLLVRPVALGLMPPSTEQPAVILLSLGRDAGRGTLSLKVSSAVLQSGLALLL